MEERKKRDQEGIKSAETSTKKEWVNTEEKGVDKYPILTYIYRMKEKMRYKFKVYEDGKDIEDKEAMSFKKLLKSLITPNPKWTGWIAYKNKKDKYVKHSILNGKRI